MIKIISNLEPGNDNDYMEHKDFQNEINRYIYENPGFKVKDVKLIDRELVAFLFKEKKQYHVGNVQQPYAEDINVSEFINKVETFILDLKGTL